MAIPGWTRTESPFHAGELAIQARLGAQERMDKQGRRVIREFLPEQHRQFFAQLPYVIAGTVGGSGNLWASILVGEPGFISSPDEHTLHVAAQPLFGDPLATTLTHRHVCVRAHSVQQCTSGKLSYFYFVRSDFPIFEAPGV